MGSHQWSRSDSARFGTRRRRTLPNQLRPVRPWKTLRFHQSSACGQSCLYIFNCEQVRCSGPGRASAPTVRQVGARVQATTVCCWTLCHQTDGQPMTTISGHGGRARDQQQQHRPHKDDNQPRSCSHLVALLSHRDSTLLGRAPTLKARLVRSSATNPPIRTPRADLAETPRFRLNSGGHPAHRTAAVHRRCDPETVVTLATTCLARTYPPSSAPSSASADRLNR